MTLKGSRSGLLGIPHMGTPFGLLRTPSCYKCTTFALGIASVI